MRKIRNGWMWLYGASPLHLLALLGCFALVGYAVSLVESAPMFTRMLVWFGAAVVAHDLVLFPACALGDRFLTGGLRRLRRRRPASPPVSPVNYIRVPVLGSGLLFLLFFAGILELNPVTYTAATGLGQEPFSRRWLLLTAAMFGVSALAYALRLGRPLIRRFGTGIVARVLRSGRALRRGRVLLRRSGAPDKSRGRDRSRGRGPEGG